jgi:hypothetical protein
MTTLAPLPHSMRAPIRKRETPMTGTIRIALAALALSFMATPAANAQNAYPFNDHNTLDECYLYVVFQFLDGFDYDGLEFGLNDCDGSYSAAIKRMDPSQLQALRRATLDRAEVDGRDFLIWQRGLGLAKAPARRRPGVPVTKVNGM